MSVEWKGDYARAGEYQLAAYTCLGGAKWSVSYGDEDCFAQGKLPWDGSDILAAARRAAEDAMHEHMERQT